MKCQIGAIDSSNPARIDKDICISCMRCISVCPTKAKEVNGFLIFIVNAMLKKACSSRKECEIFL